jgi:2-dehydro-3-deoxy-D-arabinonate dehydratase
LLVPLCLYRTDANAVPLRGLFVWDRVLGVAAAGGPASLAEAMVLPGAELRARLEAVAASGDGPAVSDVSFAAPIDRQDVWASGVTYLRSRDARMEESTQKSVYDLVYDAERPELFMKGTARRGAGPGEPVAVRRDSSWDVPEPELVLAINPAGEIIGYTVGNDVSSRSIEGENPLYLPQAKVYDRCAALGPVIALAWEVPHPRALPIALTIYRDGMVAFSGQTSTDQIHRTFEELVEFLLRDNSFPDGVFLMTGTGVVPPSEFTLEHNDEVEIAIEGIGVLRNPVVRHGRS